MTKSAGEHWVCSMLAQHGWGAALTRDGLERTDILAVHTTAPGRPMIEVQVKSRELRGTQVELAARHQGADAGSIGPRVVRVGAPGQGASRQAEVLHRAP